MLEHLFNCHGEWNTLFAFVASIPVLGAWVHAKYHSEVSDGY